MRIKKEITGHRYSCGDEWYVETDFLNERIYINPPGDSRDEDIDSIEAFGNAILAAVKDFKKRSVK